MYNSPSIFANTCIRQSDIYDALHEAGNLDPTLDEIDALANEIRYVASCAAVKFLEDWIRQRKQEQEGKSEQCKRNA